MLAIFNTLTNKKEIFKPIHIGKVALYVCGVTAYDLCHIGHVRTFVTFDVVIRYLRYCGYEVNYIRNITDIEDKIIRKAANNGESCQQLTDRMIAEMHHDLDLLNILRPDKEPRATQHIKEIIQLTRQLIDKEHAYIASNGDVMFAIESANNYGILSSQNLNQLQIGQRVKITTVKRNPMDFVLWKMSKHGEPTWSSPWGNGRPGWHIECSAMSIKYLGKHFDIHGGGSDLIFPHHENEIAQSTCMENNPYVNFWMHSGMVTICNEKMSKSLSNFFTVRDVLKYYDAETVRYFLISSHYRKPLNYSEKSLQLARTALKSLYIALRNTKKEVIPSGGEYFIEQFMMAMNNDFNTPAAHAVLFQLAHEVNRLKTKNIKSAQGMAATLRYLANILGLLEQDPEVFLQKQKIVTDLNIALIEELVKQRNNIRKKHQWVQADKVREKLAAMGIVLEDTPQGTIWRRSF
ncbi:cysteine--tRNA ligase [Candidatus Palibaumannia cicadellinicola]|uniref:Cysteine--tRNA ligase n=1 Tax=Baumannia cicadellinicola subsp. Homalodisca coagulata TaxID=374463 RepID=SYC_BAUCH|nr:cysteine--tRNA ligase [Candidatus Baumannia cicadellinicola]Q1LTX2.1 RecName: Full=Cysteine--tRNA ligase; AltName: Full=Cysteinyl-tRNA synthetase; Short=CysRS [Baumannia cicadellinicola str. Hc (Homalodisca coagulata)]ABF13873.1 cysteinyl-tRNA synthetase [Baumannia cicadellinicola str. Hc (Homalodisca coagulata)]MBS0032646.1 cysteine--tRNA ligase [Candidatus Baumannia cicadellinicola]MCJ7462426.1 cysteine--tRNA ligase [Candidatus Baumannia cicadellinicola]MCJ7463042.1 cysteine--tRNA ligase 